MMKKLVISNPSQDEATRPTPGPNVRRLCGVLAAVLLGCFHPGSAGFAQATPDTGTPGTGPSAPATVTSERPVPEPPHHRLVSAFNIAQVYQSNLYGIPNQQGADTFTLLSPRIFFEHLSRSASWHLDYGPELRRYARHSSLSTTTHAGQADFRYQVFPRLQLGVSDNLLVVPDVTLLPLHSLAPTRGPSVDPNFGAARLLTPTRLFDEAPGVDPSLAPVITGRARRTYNRFALNGRYTIDPRSELKVEAARSQLRFSRSDLIPYDNHSLTMTLSRQQTANRLLTLTYGFSRFEFGRHAPGTDSHQIAAGIRTRLTRTILADMEAGPTVASNGLRRVTGLDARLALEKMLTARLQMRVGYARVLGTAGGLSAATRNQSFLVSADSKLTRRTSLLLTATYSNYQTIFSRDLNLYGLIYAASLETTLSRHLHWFLNYQRLNQSRYAHLGSGIDFDQVAVGLRILAPLSNH